MSVSVLKVIPDLLHVVASVLPGGVVICGSKDCDGYVGLIVEGEIVPETEFCNLVIEKKGPTTVCRLVGVDN